MKARLPFVSLLLLVAVAASPQDDLPEVFQLGGAFDLGYRFRDSSGNEDKYFEHLNYRSGPRLFNFELDITSVGASAFDSASVYGSGLGGDPYEIFGLNVKKYGSYNLRFRRNRSNYFYRDTIVPHGEADLNASSGGDFHTFDFDRTNDIFHFDFDATRQVNVFVDFNRQQRLRESTTTLDIERDEFELDAPLSQLWNDYAVGVSAAFEKVSLVFDQGFRQYRSDGRIFLPGASLGENADDPTTLFFFEQLTPLDFDMPESRLRVNVRPDERLTVNLGIVASTLDGQFDYSEEDRGTSFTGALFDRLATGAGKLDASTKLFDLDVVFQATQQVSLIGGARFSRYDQESRFDSALENELLGTSELLPPAQTMVEIASDVFELGAMFSPDRRYQVSGGLRFEQRDVLVDGEEEPSTDRTSFFLNGTVSPNREWNVMAEYELGDYDNPFTRVSPTSLDRVKLRVRYTPESVSGLSLTGLVLARRLDNDVTDYSLATENYSINLRYQTGPATVYGGYTRQNWDAAIVNQVRTAPGFLGGQSFEIASLYDYRIDMLTGGIGYDLTEAVRAGVDWNVYNNRGSFGQDFRQIRLFGDFTSPAGYVLRLMYWRNSYDEVDFDFDDYGSHLVTVSIGYRF